MNRKEQSTKGLNTGALQCLEEDEVGQQGRLKSNEVRRKLRGSECQSQAGSVSRQRE